MQQKVGGTGRNHLKKSDQPPDERTSSATSKMMYHEDAVNKILNMLDEHDIWYPDYDEIREQ